MDTSIKSCLLSGRVGNDIQKMLFFPPKPYTLVAKPCFRVYTQTTWFLHENQARELLQKHLMQDALFR